MTRTKTAQEMNNRAASGAVVHRGFRASRNAPMKPRKLLGQYFLKTASVTALMIQAAKKEPLVDIVLEIGPGKGMLTRALCQTFKNIIAVEKDPWLAEGLNRNLEIERVKNCKVISGDILKTDWQKLVGETPYAVIANIPYYLTSRLIRTFLESKRQPTYMILMVQKEVGERIVAKPPHMNLLALSVQTYGKPEIIAGVSRKEFTPEPRVDATIVKISKISRGFFKEHRISENDFFAMLRAAFSQKRKQIGNTLTLVFGPKGSAEWHIRQAGVSPKSRAQELSLNEWIALFQPQQHTRT